MKQKKLTRTKSANNDEEEDASGMEGSTYARNYLNNSKEKHGHHITKADYGDTKSNQVPVDQAS